MRREVVWELGLSILLGYGTGQLMRLALPQSSKGELHPLNCFRPSSGSSQAAATPAVESPRKSRTAF